MGLAVGILLIGKFLLVGKFNSQQGTGAAKAPGTCNP
jgi:hypothetical protein